MRALLLSMVRLFPSSFRLQFGDAIAEQVANDLERARMRGALALTWHSLVTFADLATAIVAEHYAPTWVIPQQISLEDTGMKSMTQQWWWDVRHAVRSLRRAPGFAMVTIGTLGLAIGVNAGMFSVVDTVLLQPLPFANADRLMHIGASAPGSGFPDEFGTAPEFYLQYKERSKLLEDLSTYNSGTSTMRVGDRIERIRMSWPTNSMYSTLGVRPILGRLPVSEDLDKAAVISYALWRDWFGRDSSVIGKSYYISGDNRQIIGVMPPEFVFPRDGTQLWISGEITKSSISQPGRFSSALVARVKPGVTKEQLANELTAISKTLPDKYGGSPQYKKVIERHRAIVRPLDEQLLGPAARPLWVLLGAVVVVLLIACANVANLFVVRGEGRLRDLAVRRALGAGRARLIQAQMAEAVVVAVMSAAFAVVLAIVTLPAFVRAAPSGIPRIANVHLDAATLLFTLCATALAAISCGLIPAIRFSAPDFTRLRDGSRGATRGRSWGRDGLVIGQTALALVLLIGSGLLVRSFAALRSIDPGYSTEDIFTFQIAPEQENLKDGPAYARFDLAFMDRLRALPGVEAVGLVENVPLNEGTSSARFTAQEDAGNEGVVLNYTFSAGDYFKAMRMKVLRGRVFANDDQLNGSRNVIISQSAAALLWPGKDPIGHRVRQGVDTTLWTVVGVVNDVLQNELRDTPQPVVYFPLVGPTPTSWIISSPAYVVRTHRAETIAPEIKAIVHEVAPSAPMYRTYTMAELARDSMVQLSFTMLTLGIISTLALILGAVGLYGVLSYLVAQRTREIGVRMALGAEAGQVRRMVVAQGARVVIVGVVIGVVVALGSTKALETLLFGVKNVDALTFAAMSASMIAVGLLASYVPARRASAVDPMESLRGD